MNNAASTPRPKSWPMILLLLVLLVCMSLLTASCAARPVSHFTGQDYLRLKQGETFTAPRDMVLATESVVEEKDRQIVDLLNAVRTLQAEKVLK